MPTGPDAFRFDVAFSFAGSNRTRIEKIAALVRKVCGQDRVFYDDWFKRDIGSGRMDLNLQRVYGKDARLIVIALSKKYADREWTSMEWETICELRQKNKDSTHPVHRFRFMYVRFDGGKVPGFSDLRRFDDARKLSDREIADEILAQLKLLDAATRAAKPAAKSKPRPKAAPKRPKAARPSGKAAPKAGAKDELFVHRPTNDRFYTRREVQFAQLDGWARDPSVRLITITGIGGLGKTSLVGQWLLKRHGRRHRDFRGVFFYSFYADRDPAHFFKSFIAFASAVLRQKIIVEAGVEHIACSNLARAFPFLIVLDGLEVLQHGSERRDFGYINHPELNECVMRIAAESQSLLILTSRFPFTEVATEHQQNTRELPLPMLSREEGAELLAKCRLPAPPADCEKYSIQFGGHPLALRIFAGACVDNPATSPADLARKVKRAEKVSKFPDPDEPGLTEEESIRRRQFRQFHKLFETFQERLPPEKKRLLQIVALFREPVPTGTILRLATGLDAMKADFGDCDEAHLRFLLDALVREHLLQREDAPGGDTARWAAHPIVREVFRDEALAAGESVARQFAGIVAGKGEGGTPRSVAELQPILEAIEVLLTAGDFEAANDLFRGRLANGEVFKWIPAPQEGLRCARGFLEPPERRAALEKALGRGRVAIYLNWVALAGSILGEMEGVERGYEDHNEIKRKDNDWLNVSVGLQNIAEAQTLRGGLGDAVGSAGEALFYAGIDEAGIPSLAMSEGGFASDARVSAGGQPAPPARAKAASSRRTPKRPPSIPAQDAEQEFFSRAYRAHALSLEGELPAASRDFAVANTTARRNDPNNAALDALRRIWWCRHRLRLGEVNAVRLITEANRAICKDEGRNSALAQCDLLLGELDLAAGDRASAGRRIGAAVRIFRDARQMRDLPDALLAQARLRGSLEDCDEALRLAARSTFALKQCDALNLRARLRREAHQPADAAKDAHAALDIAERCGYYWGRRDALRELRDTAAALDDAATKDHWEAAERALAAKMQPRIEEALAIEAAHDRAMEKLYGKKKRKR